MNRQEMIDNLMWNSGGTGYGICSFSIAGAMIWNDMRPKTPEDDLKSVVAIMEPKDLYTDEELEKLVAFSKEKTARYDEMYRWRMGCNLIFIGKSERVEKGEFYWLRKRQSWNMGPMHSNTLDEALEVMGKN
jgi:hypothetical protein